MCYAGWIELHELLIESTSADDSTLRQVAKSRVCLNSKKAISWEIAFLLGEISASSIVFLSNRLAIVDDNNSRIGDIVIAFATTINPNHVATGQAARQAAGNGNIISFSV